MEQTGEIRNTATKIFVEGGNNADRIGGSSTVIFHQNERGQIARVMYDCGALFAPEGVEANCFVADVLKYLTIDDDSLRKAFPEKNQAEINKIREVYKAHDIGAKKLDAMFVTHMHEDHIGGLINLLRAGVKFPKIYASEVTVAVIERICQEAGISNIPEMQKVDPYQTIKLNDNFEVSAIPVSHSTAGAYAFYTKTNYNGEETGVLNMGDYNLEKTPIGEGFNENEFVKFMTGKPINTILSDSTSATLGSIDAQTPVTHDEAVKNIKEIFEEYNDKMMVAPIISRSVENLYNYLEAAKQLGLTVFLDGYMLRHAYDVSQHKGLVDDYKDTVYRSADVVNADAKVFLSQVPLNKRVVMFSGAFGEGESLDGETGDTRQKPSGFVKFVNGMHKDFNKELLTVSVVVDAQRGIPVGNVMSRVRSMLAKAQKGGAVVIQNKTDEEHSLGPYTMRMLQRTGHIIGSEMKQFLNICETIRGNKDVKMFVCPVHGDNKQLIETAKVVTETAKENKDAKMEVYIPLNGDIIHVEPDYIRAKKRLKDEDKNTYMWLGFSEITNSFGEVVYYEMSDWEEKIKDNGKVLYTRKNIIADIVAGVGKVDKKSQRSGLSEAEKRQEIVERYEGEVMHESMRGAARRSGFKGYKKSGKGGR